MPVVFANFASSTVVGALADVDTVVNVAVGEGDLFPTPVAPDYSVLVLEDELGVKEVVHLTGRTADALTIERAKEGTVAAAFAEGSRVEMRLTAEVMGSLDFGVV